MNEFISIGFNNIVNAKRVIAVLNPDTSPSKRLILSAKENGLLIDATCGRKTRAIVIMDNGKVILSGLLTETISQRLNSKEEQHEEKD